MTIASAYLSHDTLLLCTNGEAHDGKKCMRVILSQCTILGLRVLCKSNIVVEIRLSPQNHDKKQRDLLSMFSDALMFQKVLHV